MLHKFRYKKAKWQVLTNEDVKLRMKRNVSGGMGTRRHRMSDELMIKKIYEAEVSGRSRLTFQTIVSIILEGTQKARVPPGNV